MQMSASSIQTPMRFRHDPYSLAGFVAVAPKHSACPPQYSAPAPMPPPAYSTVVCPVPGTVHTPLVGQCQLIQLPEVVNAENALDKKTLNRLPRLFIGQVRLEVTANALRWLIRMTCGVSAIKVEPRGMGSFMVYLSDDTEVELVKQLHKRLVFDLSGVWFARTAEEVDLMSHYAATQMKAIHKEYRLPADAIVIEETRRPPRAAKAAKATRKQSMLSSASSVRTPASPSIPLSSDGSETSSLNGEFGTSPVLAAIRF